MSLIHEALEKAKKSTNFVKNGEVYKQARKKRRGVKFWVLIALSGSLTVSAIVLFKPWFFKRMREVESNAADAPFSNGMENFEGATLMSNRVEANEESIEDDSLRFRESFRRALSAGNTKLLREFALNKPNFLTPQDFKKVLSIFMTLDDYQVVKEMAVKADEAGKLNADILLDLAKYLEQRDEITSAYYYRRSYFAGITDPILLAKAGSLYDKLGLRDSAVKYYRVYLSLADTGELFLNIKRRLGYLAGRKW